ncbi:MAG: right-handed parallel beta-helix repeat-containing protein [bacterium]
MLKRSLILVMAAWLGFFAASSAAKTITVKQDGTGDTTTVQAALNAASDGDIIEIADDGRYVEDLSASPVLAQAGLAPALFSFTLRAAAGKHPVVEAANAETSQRMSILELPGRDMLGFAIWGCNGVTIQGIEFAALENSVNAFNVQSCITIADSANVTIEDCIVRGPGEPSPGEGTGILIAGVAANPFLTDNITIRNCSIIDPHYGITSAIFMKGSGTDANHVTIEDCQFSNTTESAVDIDNAHEAVVRRCTMSDCKYGIHFAGGNSIVEDCLVFYSLSEGLKADVDENWNDQIVGAVVRRCAFIGNGVQNPEAGVRCADGASIRFENCIIAGNGGPGLRVQTGSTTDVNVILDRCDLYENSGESEVIVEGNGMNLATLTITNSNIVSSFDGIVNEIEFEAVTLHHNNVFVPGELYNYVGSSDSVSVDPMYVSPTIIPEEFAFGDFALQGGSPVLTAGEGGTAIGSQGPLETQVKDWSVY